MPKPLAIDLYCGLGGWTEGLLAEGYRVVGFDIERHRYPARAIPEGDGIEGMKGMKGKNQHGTTIMQYAMEQKWHNSPLIDGWHEYPAQLVIQNVLTIHGSQFKNAALIVASPPCQEYSYMAMPWSRAKQIEADYKAGVRDVKQLTALFDACFRIQREACEAAGHHIPLVVENVRGAQKWVGRSRWNFGSFHLWGDVPALMPIPKAMRLKAPKVGAGNRLVAIRPDQMDESEGVEVPTMGAEWYPPDHPKHVSGLAFNGHAERAIHEAAKMANGIGRRTDKGRSVALGNYDDMRRELANAAEGRKGYAKRLGESVVSRQTSSKSPARKHASAMIAKIPLVLSRHIAKVYKPDGEWCYPEARTVDSNG